MNMIIIPSTKITNFEWDPFSCVHCTTVRVLLSAIIQEAYVIFGRREWCFLSFRISNSLSCDCQRISFARWIMLTRRKEIQVKFKVIVAAWPYASHRSITPNSISNFDSQYSCILITTTGRRWHNHHSIYTSCSF